jgi:predicted kinase
MDFLRGMLFPPAQNTSSQIQSTNGSAKQKRVVGSTEHVTSLLVLMGLPGAGKSTVAAALRRIGWFVISQDSHLSTEACTQAATLALRASCSVVVDRCNLTVSQRAVWIHLAAAEGVPCDCLHLSTPRMVCEERALARKDHRLVPEAALRVIKVLMQGTEPVTAAEGFRSHHDALLDYHIKRALRVLEFPAEIAAAAVEPLRDDVSAVRSDDGVTAVAAAAGRAATGSSAATDSASAEQVTGAPPVDALGQLVAWLQESYPRDVPLPFLKGVL